uniref:Protein kinase domain-containing protein n=1 Tax=Zooxanthella nutricula TaxID=1333877 RepID=A0A7S2QG15_9DINO
MAESCPEWEVDPRRLSLQESVGTGCTAEVFRGFLDGRTEVAIKQIDWNKSRLGASEQRAFDREVAIMPRVNHENLVKFLGVGSLTRPLRIITEFCAGGCVFDLLHNSDEVELSWRHRHKVCVDVASAMEYLHAFTPQIIHRDLKSLNLLLAEPLRQDCLPMVKVSDFGLSRMKDQSGDEWGKMTMAAGTCHWMAPEVASGSSYNEKVDVWSFSMIMFEVICREIPFEDEETADVGRLTIMGKRPDLEAVPPDCPRLMYDTMLNCWAHDPEKRPSFAVVLRALKRPPA